MSSLTFDFLADDDLIDDMTRVVELVPPQTKLADVVQQLEAYRASEEVLMEK